MTWLERILATACQNDPTTARGEPCALEGHPPATGMVCASRVAAAEGAPPPAQPTFDPAVCTHPSWTDNGYCHTCGSQTGRRR